MENKYHFSGSKTSTSKDQPLHLTKFVTTWLLPEALRNKYGNVQVIDEQLQNVGGLDVDKMPDTVEQKYYGTSRKFVGTITDTSITLSMEFECNLDRSTGEIYPYALSRDWAKLCYDAENGLQLEKFDYSGSLVVEVHDLKGKVLRKTEVKIIFPSKPANEWDLNRVNDNIYKLSMEFVAENVEQKFIK